MGPKKNDSLQMNSFEERLRQIEKLYPGKFPLVSLPRGVMGRIIDFHKAPVAGYYNRTKDLVSVEVMRKIPDKGSKSGYKLAPLSPAMIMRSRTDCMGLIGAI